MIYILGAGAMARETLDIYEALGRAAEVGGFIVETPPAGNPEIRGKKILAASIIEELPEDSLFIGAIGTPVRRRWLEEIESRGFEFDIAVHPFSSIGSDVRLDRGTIVCAGAVLTCDIEVGKHVIVNVGSTISHDCRIGSYTTIAPGVNLAGRATVGEGCWIGIAAAILEKRSVGSGCFVGAGSIVSKDIEDNSFAVGMPARVLRKLGEDDWKDLI